MFDDVAVAGRFDRSIADFVRACKVHLAEEQRNPQANSALIAVLCDAVRLAREYCEAMQGVWPRPEVEIREMFTQLMASNFRWIPTLCGACGVTYHLCRACGNGQKGNHRLFPGEDFQCQHTHDDDEPCVESRCQVAKLEAALRAVGVPDGEKK